MYAWTGSAFEGFAAQKTYPNSPSIRNMFNFHGFLHALENIQTFDGMTDSVLDRAFFLLVVVLLPVIYRLNRTWFLAIRNGESPPPPPPPPPPPLRIPSAIGSLSSTEAASN